MNQIANQTNLSILRVEIEKDKIRADISDGRTVLIPIAWFPRLLSGAPAQLRHFQISPSGYGIHWPDLDEDISVKAFVS